jgi:hypothetical protein
MHWFNDVMVVMSWFWPPFIEYNITGFQEMARGPVDNPVATTLVCISKESAD